MQVLQQDERWATISVDEDAIRFSVWERDADREDDRRLIDEEVVPRAEIDDRVQDAIGVEPDHEGRDGALTARDYRWLEVTYEADIIHVDLFYYNDEEEEPLFADTLDVPRDDLASVDGEVLGEGAPLD